MNVDLVFGLVEGFLVGTAVSMAWAARKSRERLRALCELRERADRRQLALVHLIGLVNTLLDRLGEARGDQAATLCALCAGRGAGGVGGVAVLSF